MNNPLKKFWNSLALVLSVVCGLAAVYTLNVYIHDVFRENSLSELTSFTKKDVDSITYQKQWGATVLEVHVKGEDMPRRYKLSERLADKIVKTALKHQIKVAVTTPLYFPMLLVLIMVAGIFFFIFRFDEDEEKEQG